MESTSFSVDICVFCYKFKDGVENEDNNVANRFANLLERFTCHGKNLQPNNFDDNWLTCWGCCKSCGVIVDAFCEDYQKLKCLEMKMEWKLKRLLGIMEYSGRVTSRWRNLQQEFETDSLTNLKSYRYKIINRCNARLSNSQPRVLLERYEEPQHRPVKVMTNSEPNIGWEYSDDNSPETTTVYAEDNVQAKHEEDGNPPLTIKLEDESPIFEPFTDDQIDNLTEDPLAISGLPCGSDVADDNVRDSVGNFDDRNTQQTESDLLDTHTRPKLKLPNAIKWKCKICGRNLVNKSRLEEHIKCIHTKGTPDIPCEDCGKMFLTRHRMLVHKNTVHVKATHQCHVCQKMCKNKKDLRNHAFTHQDPETWKFKCELCDKRYYEKYRLRHHMIINHNQTI